MVKRSAPAREAVREEPRARSGLRWTRDEDRVLRQRRRHNTPYERIGLELERTGLSCRLHHHNVEKKRLKKEKEREDRERQDLQRAPQTAAPLQQALPQFNPHFSFRATANSVPPLAAPLGYMPAPQQYPRILPRPSNGGSSAAQETPLAAYSSAANHDAFGRSSVAQPALPTAAGASGPSASSRSSYSTQTMDRLREAVEQQTTHFWPLIAQQTGVPAEECASLFESMNPPANNHGRLPPPPPPPAPSSSSRAHNEAARAMTQLRLSSLSSASTATATESSEGEISPVSPHTAGPSHLLRLPSVHQLTQQVASSRTPRQPVTLPPLSTRLSRQQRPQSQSQQQQQQPPQPQPSSSAPAVSDTPSPAGKGEASRRDTAQGRGSLAFILDR